MRRLARLMIALGATLAIGGGAIEATPLAAVAPVVATASAANCTVHNAGAIYYNGYWVFDAYVAGCTDVEAIQIYGSDIAGYNGMVDRSHNRVYYSNGVYAGHIWSGGGAAITASGYQAEAVNVFGPGCGYPAIVVQPFFGWRIKRLATHTWGNPTVSYADLQTIC